MSESHVDTLTQAIHDLDLEGNLRQNMKDWPGVSPQTVEGVIHWVNGYKSELLGRIASFNSEFELPSVISVAYVEYKAVWLGLNNVANYRMFRGEEPDPVLQWKAAAISMLLDAIEPHIEASELENISGYLHAPDQRSVA